jgi:hypothetical protein
MKVIIASVAILILMIGTPSAFAISAFQSGFEHGVSDGKDNCFHPDGCNWYILQPGKGFKFHTWDFVKGYVTGWCSIPANNQSGSDADEAAWDCINGPESANYYLYGGLHPKIYDESGRLIPEIQPAD